MNTTQLIRDINYHYTWYIKTYVEIYHCIRKALRWWSLHYNEYVLREIFKVKNVMALVQLLMNLQKKYEDQRKKALLLHRRVVRAQSRRKRTDSNRDIIDLRSSQQNLMDSESDKDFDILYNVFYVSALVYVALPLFEILLILLLPWWIVLVIFVLPPAVIALTITSLTISIIQSII